MLLKYCTQYASKFGKLSSGHRTGKGQFIPIPKKGKAKECSNYHTIVIISHGSKVMLKILQVRFQQHMNRELPDVQPGFRKGTGTRSQIVNICWITREAREFRKTYISALLTMPKTLCRSQSTVENSERDGNTRPPDLPLEKPICRSRSNRNRHGTMDWFQNGERSTSRQYIVILLN